MIRHWPAACRDDAAFSRNGYHLYDASDRRLVRHLYRGLRRAGDAPASARATVIRVLMAGHYATRVQA